MKSVEFCEILHNLEAPCVTSVIKVSFIMWSILNPNFLASIIYTKNDRLAEIMTKTKKSPIL
jgi:hypothetical protein